MQVVALQAVFFERERERDCVCVCVCVCVKGKLARRQYVWWLAGGDSKQGEDGQSQKLRKLAERRISRVLKAIEFKLYWRHCEKRVTPLNATYSRSKVSRVIRRLWHRIPERFLFHPLQFAEK